jgi:branched-chain amino acid aminotransferase
LFDVWTASEALICGTSAEVVPVVSVDGRRIGAGVAGPVTERIIAAYNQRVRTEGRPIYSESVAGATLANEPGPVALS